MFRFYPDQPDQILEEWGKGVGKNWSFRLGFLFLFFFFFKNEIAYIFSYLYYIYNIFAHCDYKILGWGGKMSILFSNLYIIIHGSIKVSIKKRKEKKKQLLIDMIDWYSGISEKKYYYCWRITTRDGPLISRRAFFAKTWTKRYINGKKKGEGSPSPCSMTNPLMGNYGSISKIYTQSVE